MQLRLSQNSLSTWIKHNQNTKLIKITYKTKTIGSKQLLMKKWILFGQFNLIVSLTACLQAVADDAC